MAAVATVACGLEGIVKALSFLGPLIVVFLLVVVGWSAATGSLGFGAGAAAIDARAYDITQIGGGNPLASGRRTGAS